MNVTSAKRTLNPSASETGTVKARRTSFYREPPVMATLMFLAFVLDFYVQAPARSSLLASIRFEFLLGWALIATSVAVMASTPVRVDRGKHVVIGIVLLFCVMLLQIPVSASVEIAKREFIDRVVKFAALTLFISVLIGSPRNMRWFMIAYMFAVCYITSEAFRGLITGGLVWQNQGVMRLHGAVPIYMHPNSLGGVAMGGIPFVIFLWPVLRNFWIRGLMALLLVTAVICVIYSGSRTAYVALVSLVVFWFARSKRKKRFMVTVAILTPIVVFAIPKQYIGRFESITGEEAEGHSKETRIQILKDAWEIFRENPLGVGLIASRLCGRSGSAVRRTRTISISKSARILASRDWQYSCTSCGR